MRAATKNFRLKPTRPQACKPLGRTNIIIIITYIDRQEDRQTDSQAGRRTDTFLGYLGVTPPSPPPTPLEQLFKSHLNYAHKSAKIMPRREFTTPLTASTLTHTHSDRLRLRLRQRQRLGDRVREREWNTGGNHICRQSFSPRKIAK